METILLVEDEPAIRRLIRTSLTRVGYQVIEAPDGQEALTLAADHGPRIDLLITDMRMPRLGGPELIRALRERKHTMKVLCITGYAMGAEAGCERVLYKPFNREELLEAVRQALGG